MKLGSKRMENRKFSLLINEFAQMTKQGRLTLETEQGLICHYKNRDIRIENGQRIGLKGQIVIVAPLKQKVTSRVQGKINGPFSLSKDGYLTEIKSLGCCLVRHISMPEHPRMLLEEVNQSLVILNQILKEIESNVAT
ncbi:VPA1352 family putative T3SS effector [Vibrio parahaemolyticus]|uniref:VPA1352 family putative T3SS effector n=1 Tax=Vibrio parahaemolyticus TaxID=670 RepID=UPI00226A7CAA|nr:VPA1352 family putative T3SS effector [Vibrio parahaemolyticus]MCX8763596.1 VPA1352 family putative T3SS effector [Vibrio parahaemolyticus]